MLSLNTDRGNIKKLYHIKSLLSSYNIALVWVEIISYFILHSCLLASSLTRLSHSKRKKKLYANFTWQKITIWFISFISFCAVSCDTIYCFDFLWCYGKKKEILNDCTTQISTFICWNEKPMIIKRFYASFDIF